MADVIRAALIWANGQKIGKISESSFDIEDKSAEEEDSDGHVHTRGTVLCSGSFKTIERVGRHSVDVLQLILEQQDVAITWGPVDGHMYIVDKARIKGAKLASKIGDGTLTGDFSWSGGKPRRQ